MNGQPLPVVQVDLMVERLVSLLTTPSPTGDTDDALALVAGWLREMNLAPVFTKKGALTVTLPGLSSEAPRAVTGHVDTLGAIVTQIKPSGRLAFDRIGGYPYFAVNGEYCWVRTAGGRVHTGTALLVKSSVHVHREPVRDRELEDRRGGDPAGREDVVSGGVAWPGRRSGRHHRLGPPHGRHGYRLREVAAP